MKKKNIFVITISLLISAICVCSSLFFTNKNNITCDVLYFGDSVLAGWGNESNIAERLSEKSGLQVYNAAFGGMTMSASVNEDYISNPFSLYTMVSMSECVKNNDFTPVSLASRRESEKTIDYWSDKAIELKEIDVSAVRYVIIEYGVNDYLIDVELENEADLYDITTFAGALRYSIDNVKKGIPGAEIIIESPIYVGLYNNSYEEDIRLRKYIDVERKVASEKGVNFFDAYALSGITSDNSDMYLTDKLHTNDLGDDRVASALSDYIKTLE